MLKYIDEIRLIVSENQIHVLALNETRLDDSIGDNEVKIPNYSLIRKDRNRSGGGVAIYVHETLAYSVLEHDSLLHLEAIPILIRLKNSQPILFVNWYRPPNSSSDMLYYYEQFLIFMSLFNYRFVLMGDINCDLMSRPVSSETRKYNNLNNIYSLQQVNTSECTRVTVDSSTLVDHMLTNSIDKVKSFGVIHNGLSDHSMSFLIWKSQHTPFNGKFVTFRKSI